MLSSFVSSKLDDLILDLQPLLTPRLQSGIEIFQHETLDKLQRHLTGEPETTDRGFISSAISQGIESIQQNISSLLHGAIDKIRIELDELLRKSTGDWPTR
jgi:hypothetical protein